MGTPPRGDRALTPIIGAVLIFGFLVAAFALFQVNVVPEQNQVDEFDHYNEIRTDMIQARNALVESSQVQGVRSATLRLGLSYPNRAVARNPPDPTGTIRTERIGTGEITATHVNTSAICGLGEETRTNSLVYEPHYNYLQTNETAAAIRYENSLLYRRVAPGTIVRETGQVLVQGSTINLAPLVGNVTETSSGTKSIDFASGGAGTTDVSQSFTLTIPTRLPASTWEDDLLAGQANVDSVTPNASRPSAVDIAFKPGFYTVRCAAVGADGQPDVDITADGEGQEINPTGSGDIRLREETRGSGNDDHNVTLHLNNTAGLDVEIRKARINFYQDVTESSKAPTNADILVDGSPPSANLVFKDSLVDLSPRITLPGNGTVTEVKLTFYSDPNQNTEAGLSDSDWFVVTLVYSSGETGVYFIGVPK